jgi:hypothetical protein
MNRAASEWRAAAARCAANGKPVKAQMFRNAAFEIEQEEADMLLLTDPLMVDWVMNLEEMRAGSFLRFIGQAAQRANAEHYTLMRPMLLVLKDKYPEYGKRIGRSA